MERREVQGFASRKGHGSKNGWIEYILILRNLAGSMKNVRIEFLPETFGRYRLQRIDGEENRYSKRMEVDEESALAPQCPLSLP